MNNDILNTLNEAMSLILEAKDKIKSQQQYSQRDNYLKILDNALTDLDVVSGGIQIEEKVIKDPDILERVLGQDK